MSPLKLILDGSWSVRTSQVSVSRRALIEALPRGTEPALGDDAALLLSEIVTNVVRHSGTGADDEFMVRVFEDGEHLRVEVEDAGPGFDVPVPLPLDKGYGLRLVERVASSWGMRSGARPPTVMWFELPSRMASVLG